MKRESTYKEFPVVFAQSTEEWRNWLSANHLSFQSVWLVIFKKQSKIPSVYYPEAVDEALCFGWVDSKPNKRDEVSYYQFFSKRNPKSNWSLVNKKKVEKLQKAGKMHASGLAMIALAKASGTWDALNAVDAVKEPDDLLVALKAFPNAFKNWSAFPLSTRRGILEWIQNAKQTETRNKRIQQTASLAEQNVRANQYTKKGE